jgi:hypothetical protein
MRYRHALILVFLVSALLVVGCSSDSGSPVEPSAVGTRAPFDNFQAADFTLAQSDLSSGERNAGEASVNEVGIVFRGTVAQSGSTFYMADGGNSRIMGFSSPPGSSGAAANFVLGQDDLFTTISASSIPRTASTFVFPGEVIAAEGKLLINDFNNSRILIWNTAPTTDKVPADVIVGQVDFTSRELGTSRTTMRRPTHMTVAAGKLIVSDSFSHRVLIWNSIPAANGAAADLVLGQPDFTSEATGTSASSMSSPAGVWSDGTRLLVADRNNGRVLVWTQFPTTNGEPADLVLGASSMGAGASFAGGPASVGEPQDVVSDGNIVFVSDAENSRVLMFPFPTQNGIEAIGVLGQTDFLLNAGNDPNQDGVSEDVVSARTFGNDSPTNLSLIGDRLYVSDVGNHRVLVFSRQ